MEERKVKEKKGMSVVVDCRASFLASWLMATSHPSGREACTRLEMGLAPDPKVVVRQIFRSPASWEARAVLVCLSLAMRGIMRSQPEDDTWPSPGMQDLASLPSELPHCLLSPLYRLLFQSSLP